MTSANEATGQRTPPSRQKAIRIVIADDHAVVRRGLRQVLDAEEGLEVVAEASDLAGARRYVRGHHPHVLVLDLNLPEGPSLPAIPNCAQSSRAPKSGVDHAEGGGVRARGARRRRLGYMLKEAARRNW